MKQTNYLKALTCLAAAVVMVGCSGTRYSRSTGQYIDDKATAGRVKTALVRDSMIAAGDVRVTSYRGNVHLTGFVDHPAQKERAAQLTRNVKGVGWFKNDIVVKETLPGEAEMAGGARMNEPAGAARDTDTHRQSFRQQNSSSGENSGWQRGALNVYDPAAEISSRPSRSVGAASTSQSSSATSSSQEIATEPAGSDNSQLNSASGQSIQKQSAGKITLKGTVGSEEQKRMIESQIKSIQGVNEVDNELEVNKQ